MEGLVEAGGEEAGFEAGGAEPWAGRLGASGAEAPLRYQRQPGPSSVTEESLLGEGEALDGEEFLRVFEADDGGSEAVFAGILRGAGLTVRGAWPGGFGGVGAIGGALFPGDTMLGRWQRCCAQD
jgi:hypothetical protein